MSEHNLKMFIIVIYYKQMLLRKIIRKQEITVSEDFTNSVNYQFIYTAKYICIYLISWFRIITVVRVNMVHRLLLIKMHSLTADDRYSDAQVFSIFNPPTLWYSLKELGNSFQSLVRKRWEKNVEGNHILLLH